MKTTSQLIILLILSVQLTGQSPSPIDAMVVIDNSASMKKNDPEYLLKKALAVFVQSLREDTRTGFVLFSTKVDLFLPLSALTSDSSETGREQLINFITYTGKFTNIPSAIEKAFYELKTNGRQDCDKIIVFLTDGIIDLENSADRSEKTSWLKDVITNDCSKEKIRIFSIAFTDQADFELLQTLSSKTGGNYYRALEAEDISKVFENISAELIRETPQTNPAVAQSTPTVPELSKSEYSDNGRNTIFIIIACAILFLFTVAIVLFIYFQRRNRNSEFKLEELPEAYLVDVSGITNKSTFQIRKRITRIGRVEANDLHIPDENNHVSSFHALLEFKGQNFYIIDQESVNGTFVNGKRIEKKERILLKGGDEISFDKFAFKFLCPVEGERGQTVLNVDTTTGTNTVQHLPGKGDEDQDSNSKE